LHVRNQPSIGVSPEVISAGVDYFSVTAQHPDAQTNLSSKVYPLIHSEQRRGNEPKRWTMSGFEGLSCGQVQLGQRHDGIIARLSGELASQEWFELYQTCERVTRVDVQATVRFGNQLANQLRRHYREAMRHHARWPSQSAVTKWESTDGGYTIYFGARVSERFGRVYNKEAESKEKQFAGCVRYEVELKGKSAQQAAQTLTTGAMVASLAGGMSREFLEARGLSLGFLDFAATRKGFRVQRTRSDASCTLAWLGKSVRPCVQALIEGGKLVEVLGALGLSDQQLRNN
jgi:DNA relaxase NicK